MNRREAQVRRELRARLEARRPGLLDRLAGDDPVERERLNALSTGHLIALTHVNPTLFNEEGENP